MRLEVDLIDAGNACAAKHKDVGRSRCLIFGGSATTSAHFMCCINLIKFFGTHDWALIILD